MTNMGHLADEERGVRALPAGATPAQRARAEAVWRPDDPAKTCRCSGKCPHGEPCTLDGPDTCNGKIVHIDRYPGSIMCVTEWADDYVCSEGLHSVSCVGPINLPDIPWGELLPAGPNREHRGVTCYPGVRHPNFLGTHHMPEVPDVGSRSRARREERRAAREAAPPEDPAVIEFLVGAAHRGLSAQFEIGLFDLFMLVSAVQLAMRHPEVPETVREGATRVGRGLAAAFDGTPAAAVVEAGWDPGRDV